MRRQPEAGDHHDEQQEREGFAGAGRQLGEGQDPFEVNGHGHEQQPGQGGPGADLGGEEGLPGHR